MLNHRIAVNIAFFINGFIYANWVSRLPRIQELFGADNQAIGFVLLAMSLGAVTAMPFTGWAIIRNGSRKITLVSLVLYSAVVPLIPFMPGWAVAMTLYFCMGIVTGMLDVAMNAQAVMIERMYQKPIMTSFHAFFSIGMALGAWSGAFFADTDLQLEWHFSIVVMLALIATIWVGANLINDRPDKNDVSDGPLFRLPTASLASVGFIAFCCMLGEGSMADWTVNYMENFAGSAEAIAPLALSAFAVAMTGGRLFGDRVRARIGDGSVILYGGILSTFGIFIIVFFPEQYLVITGCFLVGLGLSTIVPITYSIAGNRKELPSGVGLAMVTTVGYSGFLFGPPIIGFIADWQNLRIAFLFVAALFVVMTVLGIVYKVRNRHSR